MGFLDSVKNALKGAVAPPARTVAEPRTEENAPAPEPAPAPVPEPTPEPTFSTYTIRTGDTLRDIGARHGVARDDLARLNDIAEPDLIFPGQQLRIPTT